MEVYLPDICEYPVKYALSIDPLTLDTSLPKLTNILIAACLILLPKSTNNGQCTCLNSSNGDISSPRSPKPNFSHPPLQRLMDKINRELSIGNIPTCKSPLIDDLCLHFYALCC
jgi:hypothetical protein